MKKKTTLPPDFGLTTDLRNWGIMHGHSRLQEHMDYFLDYARATDKQYADWNAAFRNAVRGDWAKLKAKPAARMNLDAAGAKPGESWEQYQMRVRN